jgi:hypothetical protein
VQQHAGVAIRDVDERETSTLLNEPKTERHGKKEPKMMVQEPASVLFALRASKLFVRLSCDQRGI